MEVNEILAKHEQQLKSLEKRMAKVEETTKPLERLDILIELQREQTKEIIGTLSGINENLSNLNHGMESLKNQVGDINNRVTDLEDDKLQQLEDKIKNQIDMKYKIIGGVITSVVVAIILFWLGLK